MSIAVCPQCQARCRVPVATGRLRIRCPRCGSNFVQEAQTGLADQPQTAPRPMTDSVKVHCAGCGANFRAPAHAAGRRTKCPKCKGDLQIPAPAALIDKLGSQTQTAPVGGGGDEFLYKLAEGERVAAPVVQPPTVQGTGGGRMCPGCGNPMSAEAKICTDCGIDLKTGRSLLTTQDENLDEIYAFAERAIWVVSWIIWLGVYPIASEAFGLAKPYVTRGLVIVTVAVSLLFLVTMWFDLPAAESCVKLMHWTGKGVPEISARTVSEYVAENPELTSEQAREQLEAQYATVSEYHPYQLLTSAFLHGGLIHLAGNMLFLLVFGSRVNALIGNLWMLGLYPLFAIVSSIAHGISMAGGPPTPSLGASGAVMGLAGMYLVLFPVHRVHMALWMRWGLIGGFHLSLKSFAVRGFWVVLFYIAFDVVYTIFRLEDDVAHWAHLGGFIAGIATAAILLLARLINARGGDLFSVILGRHAWALVGRPRV
jgi:membrane associated rhomboid family serine protease